MMSVNDNGDPPDDGEPGAAKPESDISIDLDSAAGKATTLTIHLPRAEAKEKDTPSPEEVAPEPATGKGTVLLVEDSGMVRDVTGELLEGLGYEVLPASDGTEAMGLAERIERIDLLFTDVVMPGDMNGVELAEALRVSRPALDVILMSGYPDTELSAQGIPVEEIRAGGTPFLHKPFLMEDLQKALETTLGAARD